MNQDKLKQMYANGGLLKALLKDPAQRKMAAQMLGGKEYGQGGMMKYANGGPVGPGGKKIPTFQEYFETQTPYYEYGSVTTPDYSGEGGREKFQEFILNQALPQMMINEGVRRYDGYEDNIRRIAEGYKPAEGQSWNVNDLQQHIAESLGPEHMVNRRPIGGGSTMLENMFGRNLGDYMDTEGVFESALYQVDPSTGQRTRVTQEMYEQMGSPTEMMRLPGGNRARYYQIPAEGSDLYEGYRRTYRNPDTRSVGGSAVFR